MGSYARMLRAQVIAVLKELVTYGLIVTAWVSYRGKKAQQFWVKVEGQLWPFLIDLFLQKHNLKLEENKEKGLLVIY